MTASDTTRAGTENAEITGAVVEIVAEVLGVEAADLGTDTDLRAVEGADSIKVLRIIAKIEQRYDVELEDEDVFGVSTIAQVVEVVGAALGRQPS
jgi:acyl carrier protein